MRGEQVNYVLRESAVVWLKEKGFEDSEIDELQQVLNTLDLRKKTKDDLVLLPKNTGKRIAAIVYLLNLVTDSEGKPLCCDAKGLIEIPDEAKRYFEDELEFGEIETDIGKLQKVKFGRTHSRAKRRSSVKKESYKE
jgi:hypothetical protein